LAGVLLPAGASAQTPATPAATASSETDVDGTAYSTAVNVLAQHGITPSCGKDQNCAEQNLTRQEMAVFIIRAIWGSDNFPYSATPYFADVPASADGFKWIQKMYELGITAGCTYVNGVRKYCPDDFIPRNQMAIFLIRARYGAAGAPDFPVTPYFADVPATDTTYFKWIQRMKHDGITGGCGTGMTYCPGNFVTRSDMAISLARGAFNQLLPAGAPVVTSISPAALTIGPVSTTFTLTGVNTHWVQGPTSINPIPGVMIGTIKVNSTTSMTVQMTAGAALTLQPYSVLAMTGSEEAVLPNGLNITPGTAGNLIANSGFELPALASRFQYAPNDPSGSWTFVGLAGVSTNGSGFTGKNSSAPEGSQVAFIQGTGTMSQVVKGFQPGASYVLSFSAAGRVMFNPQSIAIQIANPDGGNVTDLGMYRFVNTDPAYQAYKTRAFSRTSGTARITIKGLIAADATAFLDDIQIVPAP
jgi:hypothetical protein